MWKLRSDSRVSQWARALLAAAWLCAAAATLSAGESEPSVDPVPSADPVASADPVLAAVDELIEGMEIDKSDEHWKLKVIAPPGVAKFDPEKTYIWNLATNRGELKIKLLPASAPFHVTSTIYLTRIGFYDDVKFHRIVTDFMAQGGDPTGTGNGGPGYMYGSEIDPDLSHNKRGIVSMANAGQGTDGSQFFIMFGPAPALNGKHTIFGQVVEGTGTLKMIERASSSGKGKPKRQVIIEKATISVE